MHDALAPELDQPGLEQGAVAVVSTIKNERSLLPHFFTHYRRLGVTRFLIVDNGSTDGSFEWLRSQPDTMLFRCAGSFRGAHYGMDWMEQLANRYCQGHWTVYADADELLVYQDCERVDIRDYCRRLGRDGFDTVYGAMMDLYPDGDFRSVEVRPDEPVLDTVNRFDADYVFRPWPRRPWDGRDSGFSLQVLGGPRFRLLSSLERERRRGAFHYTLCNQVDRFIDKVPAAWVPAVARVWPLEVPALQKQPLNLVTPGFRFHNSHCSSNERRAHDFVALLHIKLCQELRKRLDQPEIVHNHYRRGLSYHQLRQAIQRWEGRSLAYPGSRVFRGSRDLSDAGLIGPSVAALWSGAGVREVRTPLGQAPGVGPRPPDSREATAGPGRSFLWSRS